MQRELNDLLSEHLAFEKLFGGRTLSSFSVINVFQLFFVQLYHVKCFVTNTVVSQIFVNYPIKAYMLLKLLVC